MADYFDQSASRTGSTPIALDPDNRYGISSAESGAYYETQFNAIAQAQLQRDAAHAAPGQPVLRRQCHGGLVNDLGTFTVLPAYRESHLDTEGTGDRDQLCITHEDDRQNSIEARLASNLSRQVQLHRRCVLLRRGNHVPLFVPNTQYTMSVQIYGTGVESAAAFGQLTY